MLKKIISLLSISTLLATATVYALTPIATARYFNGPTVSSVTDTSAQISLTNAVLNDITPEEKSGIYFEYSETNQVCIAIYPTPEYCLPKKTEKGKTSVILTDLKPNTSYTVLYKRDNTIQCFKTPCPGNGIDSLSVEFKTLSTGTVATGTIQITKNLWIGSRGTEVSELQTLLIQKGYLKGSATGYFGGLTFQAVREYQRDMNILSTGFVGPLTRASLNSTPTPVSAEKFEGTITAYSTQCFVDGECSITVDGKKIITTIGWSQQIVGSVQGLGDEGFGGIEKKIGTKAKVYAKKIDGNTYTLYGSTEYYVLVQ